MIMSFRGVRPLTDEEESHCPGEYKLEKKILRSLRSLRMTNRKKI